jgi:uncharacterized protein (DUF1501 family)
MRKAPSVSVRRPVSRRGFLAAGSVSVVGLSAAERAARLKAQLGRSSRTVVCVIMNGGASQLETFDPKPEAPREIRGSYRAIDTAVPGMQLCDLLPRLAQRAKSFSLIRSLYHNSAPIHETGLQFLQAGALANRLEQPLAFGAQLQRTTSTSGSFPVPAYVVTPNRFAVSARSPYSGDGGDPAIVDDGLIRTAAEGEVTRAFPKGFEDQPYAIQDSYGRTHFGKRMWAARQLVEHGATWITVNLFDRLDGQATWDAHGAASAPATLADYGHTLCPQFDRAMSAFIDDLITTGLWHDVMVVCTGEMGRTPKINRKGGRDHWVRCWSALIAGGGIPGGTVIGQSDSQAAEPVDRPIHVRDLAAAAFASAGGSLDLTSANRDPLPEIAASRS